MMVSLLKSLDPFVVFCFQVHDSVSNFIAENFLLIKRVILIVAYLSLSFVLFPEMRRGFGSLAEGMLLGILFLSPLSKIFRMRLFAELMGLRREFGILMGCLALVHGIAYFIDPTSFSINIAPYLNAQFFTMQPLYYFGILALLITLPLFLTSNNISVRFLGGKRWKLLHRSAYALLLIMLLHILFLRSMRRGGYSFGELISPVSIVLGYVLLKVLAWKNFLPFLRDAITYISERYTQYRMLSNGLKSHRFTDKKEEELVL